MRRPSPPSRLASFAFVLAALAACADAPADDLDDPLGATADVVARRLAPLTVGTPRESSLEYHLVELDDLASATAVDAVRCEAVQERLDGACAELVDDPERACAAEAVFLMAHQTPRCAVRVTVAAEAAPPFVLAMDLSGAPDEPPPPGCGDGIVDEGEACDDGNLDAWDGCDATCASEPFEGCEAVIEEIYAGAGIAAIDAEAWRAPRSHLMVNQGRALVPVERATCDQAIALGDEVCHALGDRMPFVRACEVTGALVADACAIRIAVGFDRASPDDGVFTDELAGLLAFTIR